MQQTTPEERPDAGKVRRFSALVRPLPGLTAAANAARDLSLRQDTQGTILASQQPESEACRF